MKRQLWARALRSLFAPRTRTLTRRGPILEHLESRLAPATFIWTGGAGAANTTISTGANWQGGVAPSGLPDAGDDLVFPASATQRTVNNDLPQSGNIPATFKSISIIGDLSGSFYSLAGNSITLAATGSSSGAINVGPFTTGTRIDLELRLGGQTGDRRFITVGQGSDLTISRSVSSDTNAAELSKNGQGLLVLTADNSNYRGPISVQEGALRISNRNALGTVAQPTTVAANAQLQLSNVAGTILEPLILNGNGGTGDGALQNFAGNNTWAGTIALDSNAIIGARGTPLTTPETTLTVTGQISDLGAGRDLVKMGTGTVVFTNANTYRGVTTVRQGVLRITNPLALGPAVGSPETGTVVNSSPTVGAATLQIAGGFTVANELLTLNGAGFGGIGALHNLTGNNVWGGRVFLGSLPPDNFAVSIGVASGTNLIVSGVVSDPNSPGLGLSKIQPGRLIFNNANTYTGFTTVAAGTLTIRDSRGLGTNTNGTSVTSGATLELEVETDPANRFDPQGRDLFNDSVTGLNGNGPQSGLSVTETLTLNGTGVGGGGALRSVSGINRFLTQILLGSADASIGVDPDPSPSNTAVYFTNDYSLTIGDPTLAPGVDPGARITNVVPTPTPPTTLRKTGTGQLILPYRSDYTGVTAIEQGWVTVQNTQSLGAFVYGADTLQPRTTVANNAALHIRPRDFSTPFQFLENLTLSGNGIVNHPFPLINQKGALMSLGGNNTIGGPVNVEVNNPVNAPSFRTSDIFLTGNTGIGVESLVSEVQTITAPVGTTFTLSFTDPAVTTGALSANSSAADVATALNALNTIGGIAANVTVTKTVTGTGSVFTVVFGGYLTALNVPPLQVASQTGGTVSVATTVEGASPATSSLAVTSSIFNVAGTTGGITKLGSQRLALLGDGSYTGDVNVNEGVLRAQNDTALGLASTGTSSTAPGTQFGAQVYSETSTVLGVGIREVQSLTVTGSSSGAFRLTFNGATTPTPLPANATETQVQAALNNLPTIGANGVTVNKKGNVYVIAFTGASFAGVNQSQILATPLNGSLVAANTVIDGDGTALELSGSNPANNGGISAGLNIWNERLVLRGLGNFLSSASPLTVLQNDHLWHGPMVLNSSAAVEVRPDARLTVQGTVSDVTPANLVLTGGTGDNEVQEVTLSNSLPANTFRLTFKGETTRSLQADSHPSFVQQALNELSTIGGVGGSVQVTKTGNVYSVTFDGSLGGVDHPELTGTGTGVTVAVDTPMGKDGGNGRAGKLALAGVGTYRGTTEVFQGSLELLNAEALGTTGTPEVQMVTVGGSALGSFKLSFNGETTDAALQVNATAQEVQDALNSLDTIGKVGGNVTVSKAGNVFTITFLGTQLGFNQPQLIATAFAGATANVATTTDGKGGTEVLAGASLELVGNLTVAGEPLILQGKGSQVSNIPPRWFSPGPAPTNNGQTAGNLAVSGRVNASAVDPTDANVIYIATAGGGSWKTKDGGKTWTQLFDSSPVHRLSLPSTVGTFTLTYNGATTAEIALTANRALMAARIQDALNDLPTLKNLIPAATVSVAAVPGKTLLYDITFGGSLSGTTPALITAAGTGGTSNPVITASTPTMNVGAIAIDVNDPRIVYIGTGEANNTTDSFYGTGVYKSIDSGKSWMLLTSTDGTNPLVGLGVTDIVVDYGFTDTAGKSPFTPPQPGWGTRPQNAPTGRIFVSTSNQNVANAPGGGLTRLAVTSRGGGYNPLNPPAVTITGGGGSGAEGRVVIDPTTGTIIGVNLTNAGTGYTAPPTVTIAPPPAVPGALQATAVSYIQGTPGIYRFDEVTRQVQALTVPGLGTGGSFRLRFTNPRTLTTEETGSISLGNTPAEAQNVAGNIQRALIALPNIGGLPVPQIPGFVNVYQSLVNPLVFEVVFTGSLVADATPQPNGPPTQPALMTVVAEGTTPAPIVHEASTWVSLTSTATTPRTTLAGQTGAVNPNRPPGPTDDFRVNFPQNSAAWTDLSLVYFDNSTDPPRPAAQHGTFRVQPVLYAALSASGGNVSNGVFRTENPTLAPENISATTWFAGDPGVPMNEVQQLIVPLTAGIYQLRFANSELGPPIPPAPTPATELNQNSSADRIAQVLNNLSTIGGIGGQVTVVIDAANTNAMQRAYTITFGGALAMSNQPAIVVVQGGLAATINTITEGSGTDTRSGVFPGGNYDNGVPRNGNIKIATWVDPHPNVNIGFRPTFNQVTVYAAISFPNDPVNYPGNRGQFFEIQRTSTGGKTWATVAAPTLLNYQGSQGHYNSAIVATSASRVFVAGQQVNSTTPTQILFETTDAGATWVDRSVDTLNRGPHTSVHGLAVDSTFTKLVASTDGGVFQLNLAGTRANQWDDLNGTLAITQFNSVAGHPSNLTFAAGGARFNGTQIFTDDMAWRLTDPNDGGVVRVDPKKPQTLYHIQNTNVLEPTTPLVRKSTNSGQTWTTIRTILVDNTSPVPAAQRYVPFAIDQIDSERILVGGFFNPITNPNGIRLQESLNGGTDWVRLDGNVNIDVTVFGISGFQGTFQADLDFDQVPDIGSNSYDRDTIYATNGSTIRVTKNHASTWVTRNLPGNLGSIVDIAVDPSNRDTAYVVRNAFDGQGRKIFRTTNAGRTWTDITSNLPNRPAWKVVIDPRYGDLYLGNDTGVFRLAPGSTTWTRFGDGLANVQVRDLELNQSNSTLLVGTYGRSAYRLFLDDSEGEAGAMRAVAGNSVWTGVIQLVGDADGEVAIGAKGSPAVQNGITVASLNLLGTVVDQTPGTTPTLLKRGLGDVILSSVNTYEGLTVVEQGALVVRNSDALGSEAADTFVNPGAALELESDLELEPVTIEGDGIAPAFNAHPTGALRNVTGNNTYTGTLTLGTNATVGVDTGTTLTIGTKAGLNGMGTITDGTGPTDVFNLTKELTGTLILNTANTYDGVTRVEQGAIRVSNNTALGSGGTAANGTVVVNGAAVEIESPAGGPPVVVADERLSLSGTGIRETGALRNTGGDNTWQAPITLAVTPGFSPTSSPDGTVSFGVTNAGDELTISGIISDPFTGVANDQQPIIGVRKVEAGTLILENANTYDGTTYVQAGSVRVRDNRALGEIGSNEVQRITVITPVAITDGTFRLAFRGVLTPAGTPLAFNAPALTVQNALNALSTIAGVGAVQVTRVQVPDTRNNIFVYTVRFTGGFANTDQPILTALGQQGTSPFVSSVAEGQTGTLVSAGAAVEVEGNLTGVPESIGLNGTGTSNSGALRQISGSSVWTGNVVMVTNASIGVDGPIGTNPTPQLRVEGTVVDYVPVSGATPAPVPAPDLTKLGAGTLVFPNRNTYSGNTTVENGVLNIRHELALGDSPPEQQTVTILGAGGSFTLMFQGVPTNRIDILSPMLRAMIETELNNLSTITAAGGVTVQQGTGNFSNVYTITFNVTATPRNQPQIMSQTDPGVQAQMATFRDGPEGTVVANGGTLQVQRSDLAGNPNLTVTTEALTLNGAGFQGQGALVNEVGNNTWQNPILLGSDASIGVTQAADVFTINRPISGGTNGVTKVGVGTLDYTAANTYTGTTQVNEGTLRLANTNGPSLSGSLTVGDATGNPATALWLADNQVPDTATVFVQSDGTFNLNGRTETINTLRMVEGQSTTGTVGDGLLTVDNLDMTGGTLTLATALSRLFLNGNVTATSNANQSARILGSGQVSFNGQTRTFLVNDGEKVSDLIVQAVLAGTNGEGLTKTGAGRLELDAINTYAGVTTINLGDVQVDGRVGDVVVNAAIGTNASLSGVGRVGTVNSTNVPVKGTVNPGANDTATPTGVLTSGSQTWGLQTTFFVNLNNTTPGSGHDQLVIDGGVLSLNGATVAGAVAQTVSLGDSFTVIRAINGGRIDAGSKFAEPASPNTVFLSGQKFSVDYTDGTAVILRRVKNAVTLEGSSSRNPSFFGETVTFTATLTPELGVALPPTTTTVTFRIDGGDVQTKNIDANGKATFTASFPLGVGSHPVELTFNGNVDYDPVTVTLNQIVEKSPTQITPDPIVGTPVFGQAVTVTATVTPVAPGAGMPTGNVIFTVDGTTQFTSLLNGMGQASVVLTNLSVSVHRVSIAYVGDGNFNASSTFNDFPVTVAKANSDVDLSSPSSTALGETATFTVTVGAAPPGAGLPTGTVSFFDGPVMGGTLLGVVTLANGMATLDTSDLPMGQRVITAQYSGDQSFNSGTDTLIFNVGGARTTTDVSGTPNGSRFGQLVTVTAMVGPEQGGLGTVAGSVQFTLNGVPFNGPVVVDAQGRAILQVNNLPVGNNVIGATFTGTGDFGDSADQYTQVVVRSDATTTVISTLNPSAQGQAVTFTARVSATAPGGLVPNQGTVTFFIDGRAQTPIAIDGQGRASLTRTNLTRGNHTIVAKYNGNGNYNPSPNSATLTQRVVAFATSTVLTRSVSPSVFGQSVAFTARVVGVGGRIPTGTVTFFVDNVQQGAAVALNASGVAVKNLANLAIGTRNVVARYNGGADFGISQAGVTQVVRKANSVASVVSSRNPAAPGTPVTFTAIVAARAPGGGVPQGQVVFKVDGTDMAPIALNGQGRASITVADLTEGMHQIMVSYLGSGNYEISTSGVLTQFVQTPPAVRLAVTVTPSSTVGVNTPFSLTVRALDAANQLSTTYNQPGAVVIASGPAGGTLGGNVTATFVNGVAQFTGLRVSRNGRYVLRVTTGTLVFDLVINTTGRQT